MRRECCTCSMPFAPSFAELPSWQAERLRRLHSSNKLLQRPFSTQLGHQRRFGFRGLPLNPFLHSEAALKLLLLRCKSATHLELLPSTPHVQIPVEKQIAGITPEVPFVPWSWQHARHDSGKQHLPLGHTWQLRTLLLLCLLADNTYVTYSLATCLKRDLCSSRSVCSWNLHSPLVSCTVYLSCFALFSPTSFCTHLLFCQPWLHFQDHTLECTHIFHV